MTVVCKVDGCAYRSASGFCRREVLPITEQGFCGQVYDKRGRPRLNWMDPADENLIEGIKSKKEEENET